jgi:hypothetical protein
MKTRSLFILASLGASLLTGCAPSGSGVAAQEVSNAAEAPEYFQLRPAVEKAFGYTLAVRIGDDI